MTSYVEPALGAPAAVSLSSSPILRANSAPGVTIPLKLNCNGVGRVEPQLKPNNFLGNSAIGVRVLRRLPSQG